MKTFSFKIIGILFAFIALSSCSNDDDNPVLIPPEGDTIADIVTNTGDYSLLLAALIKTDLAGTLSSGEYTVFAPNNAAFTSFLAGASLDDVPTEDLKQILLNHVLSGTALSTSLTTGYVSNLATEASSGEALSTYINISDGVKINGVAAVTGADIIASNGVIHAVDNVIPLPTVVTFAVADPTFSSLVAALTREDQPDFVSTLSTAAGTSPAPFTVFAPTDAAFTAVLTELGAALLADIDTATLTATLNLHVIAEANVRAAQLTDGVQATLGGDITISATNTTITDSNDRVSAIVVTDVQASNGVIHAIDKVILPQL